MTSPQVIEQVKAKLAAMHAEEAREAEALRVTRYVVFAMFAILLAVAAGLLLRPRANGGGADDAAPKFQPANDSWHRRQLFADADGDVGWVGGTVVYGVHREGEPE